MLQAGLTREIYALAVPSTELGQHHISTDLTWGKDTGKPHSENEKQTGFSMLSASYVIHHVDCPLIMCVC